MSWMISRVGKREAVAAAVAYDIRNIKSSGPEETIKNTLGHAIATLLAAFPSDSKGVFVEASGIQDSRDDSGRTINRLTVNIASIYDFLE
jgi:hypothetical protein